MEAGAFPSDRFAVESQLKFHGLDPKKCLVEVDPQENALAPDTTHLLSEIEKHADELALILLPGVHYLSGQVYDISAITAAAHRAGAKAGFDLAHAIGNIPLKLHEWGADFAVWCSYKYLNAGPGAVGGIFVHEKHASDDSLPRFAGWFGQDGKRRFLMEKAFHPAYGAEGWQLSNENILSLAALRASLEEFTRFDFAQLVARRQLLVAEMETMLKKVSGLKILTPSERGGQLSVQMENGKTTSLFEHLKSSGIAADFRRPDVIRLAIAPLYNTRKDLKWLQICLNNYPAIG